ncbi:hypothetical protein [Trinickia fusca]|uniref:Pilus assembly protein n=1 Tax=Trinickia fusca TaxID=2419777 RepID=A0A494X6I7_9BURK|nr:hypothetical protein [Trinickia fusca]RKP43814.1 hypothetical protein D7S89_24320 [Trinickia fusca]
MKLDLIVFARRALAIVPACALLGGCMSSSPIWDAHFGEAVTAIRQAQVIDANAGVNKPSADGIDGKTAVSTMAAYDKSYTTPAPPSYPFVIGIGSGTSAAQ